MEGLKHNRGNRGKDLTVKEACNNFLIYCRVKNLSEYTISDYKEKLQLFISYIGESETVKTLTQKTIDNYILYCLDEKKITSNSVNSYLRDVRVFVSYLTDLGHVHGIKVKMIKCEKPIKETYSNNELEILLKKPDTKNCSFCEFKTWVFENWLVGTGTRITTALNVRIGDLDFSGATIQLNKTKNHKGQIIPMSRTLSCILKEYLSYREGKPEDYLFCDDVGEQGKRHAYQQIVAKYNRSRGIARTSCHAFRHTFAKNWILAGGDVFRLQKILGHSDIAVTRQYVEMFGQDLQADFDKFNILDNIHGNKKKIKM